MIYQIPPHINDQSIATLISDLRNHINDDELAFGFSDFIDSSTFATLVLAESIKEIVSIRIERNLSVPFLAETAIMENSPIQYLDAIGFFVRSGLLDKSESLDKFLPIQILKKSNFQFGFHSKSAYYTDAEKEIETILQGCFDNASEERMINYCLASIAYTMFYYFKTDTCSLLMNNQKDTNGSTVTEIAVADAGVNASFINANKNELFLDDADEILRNSIKPDLTHILTGQHRGMWDIAGLRLFTLAQLGCGDGAFRVCTGGKLLTCSKSGIEVSNINWFGTAINLDIRMDDADYFPNVLWKIISNNENIAKVFSAAVMENQGGW